MPEEINNIIIANRLREIREMVAPLGASEFSRKIEMKQPTYARYEKGDRTISAELIKALVLKINLNVIYLFTGTGPMFLPQKSEKQQKYEHAFSERKTFGKRLNYYQGEENLNDIEIAKIIDASEGRVEKLGLDKAEPTLAELRALKSHSGTSIDLWLDGDLKNDSGVATQFLSAEEQKMLEFLKKAKKNNLL